MNALQQTVTRNSYAQRVITPASASASASASVSPNQGETNVGTCTPLTQAEWDFLVSEREAIMHESGMVSSRCLPMALADTTRRHGARPRGEA